ncbi:MAG: hypothetical protein J0M00_02705 [Burkholderiales bacterium]|nr:hypothetical protein [Burkholderiales bacterium]
MPIDTDSLSDKYRPLLVDSSKKRILISKIEGSGQEADLTKRPNASGLGRIHNFRRQGSARWVENPLPIEPACAFLRLERRNSITAQVFQNAACNWRCWYCYVPFDMLGALPGKSEWATVDQLVDAYARLEDRPPILDLSGGQPELSPEWVLWTMSALERAGIDKSTYLWSDDNLSNDYFWRHLTAQERERIVAYPGYGKVGCFKGFDESSFAFNTEAAKDLFDRQFELFDRYVKEGLDIYAYVTFTHPDEGSLMPAMERFVDRLQMIDHELPARTIPLEISAYGPVQGRLDDRRRWAMEVGQYRALDAWQEVLLSRRLGSGGVHE